MAYSLSAVEREVSLTFDGGVIAFNAGEDCADLYTSDPAWIRKMDKLVEQNPEQFQVKHTYNTREGKVHAKRYIFPKRFITIRSKDVKRELTEDERVSLSEKMKAMNKIKSTARNTEQDREISP